MRGEIENGETALESRWSRRSDDERKYFRSVRSAVQQCVCCGGVEVVVAL